MHLTIEADLRALRIEPDNRMYVQLVDEELDYFDEELPVLAAEKITRRQAGCISFSPCFATSGLENTRVFRLRKGPARRLYAHTNNLPGWKATLSVSVRVEHHDGVTVVIPVVDAITLHP